MSKSEKIEFNLHNFLYEKLTYDSYYCALETLCKIGFCMCSDDDDVECLHKNEDKIGATGHIREIQKKNLETQSSINFSLTTVKLYKLLNIYRMF